MLLVLASYCGGVLTILSPCILPVLPFVFARAGQPFRRSGLPLLLGMAATFALVATLAAVGGGWAAHANQYGRYAAIALLGCFGLALLLPQFAERMTRPLVAMGTRLSTAADGSGAAAPSVRASLVLGIATGLLWAPCAGPILGLLLTGAALKGASGGTTLLLLAYALGAATSLAAALLLGGRVLNALKRSLGAGEWIRRALGVAVLIGVAAIALGLDTGVLTRVSLARTSSLEQWLLDRLHPPQPASSVVMDAGAGMMMMSAKPHHAATGSPAGDLPVEGQLPPLSGAALWLNSPPLTAEDLRGKVVLIDFWTYSCINCLRTLPYVRAWADKYRDQGLVVIGVHAPEFAFEKDPDNVRRAVADLKIDYPVALDNDYAIWRAFNNEYWPAHYFIDAQGRIRHHHFGEGGYTESEQVIRQLLAEAGHSVAGAGAATEATGIGLAPDQADLESPETYLGYARAESFASSGGEVHDFSHDYSAPPHPNRNDWGLAGTWNVHEDKAVLGHAGGRILYRFHARDLHLVLGPAASGKPVRFRVLIDGKPPNDSHGTDTDATGQGQVTTQRLYQLVRQNGTVQDRTFEIEFLDPGVEAYSFTFG
jgi:cytochrome c biogenesis protein CcdA/thiol-disulfide isomerase/thioredoxin